MLTFNFTSSIWKKSTFFSIKSYTFYLWEPKAHEGFFFIFLWNFELIIYMYIRKNLIRNHSSFKPFWCAMDYGSIVCSFFGQESVQPSLEANQIGCFIYLLWQIFYWRSFLENVYFWQIVYDFFLANFQLIFS